MYKFKIKVWDKFNKKAFEKDIITVLKDRQQDYYTLYFFDNAEEMYAWFDKRYGKSDPQEHEYLGMVKYMARNYYEDEAFSKIIDYSKSCGIILLNLEDYSAEILCHEVSHASSWYFGYRIKQKNKIFTEIDYNELYCYITGNIAKQVNTKYYDILYKKATE